jgi:HSP20 family molecular chaperone IbpA
MKTDIKENEGGYELDIDLPGYNKEDVNAQLKDGYMTISAETKQENDEQDNNGKYIRRERYYGTCSRSFYVGEDITEQDIKAKFDNGVLKVFVPKKEAQPVVEETKYIAIEG